MVAPEALSQRAVLEPVVAAPVCVVYDVRMACRVRIDAGGGNTSDGKSLASADSQRRNRADREIIGRDARRAIVVDNLYVRQGNVSGIGHGILPSQGSARRNVDPISMLCATDRDLVD